MSVRGSLFRDGFPGRPTEIQQSRLCLVPGPTCRRQTNQDNSPFTCRGRQASESPLPHPASTGALYKGTRWTGDARAASAKDQEGPKVTGAALSQDLTP